MEIVCQAFLRLFDKQFHDVAKTHGEIRAFKLTFKTLFLKVGYSTALVLSAMLHRNLRRPLAGMLGKTAHYAVL